MNIRTLFLLWSLVVMVQDGFAAGEIHWTITLKTAVEHTKIPFALSPSATLRRALSKGGRDFGVFTKWGVSVWKPFMLDRLSRNGFHVLQLRFLGSPDKPPSHLIGGDWTQKKRSPTEFPLGLVLR